MSIAIAFQIKKNGTVAGLPQYFAERGTGELLATISPRLEHSGKYSACFLNVCFIDGKTEIADGINHASDLIERKYF